MNRSNLNIIGDKSFLSTNRSFLLPAGIMLKIQHVIMLYILIKQSTYVTLYQMLILLNGLFNLEI